MEARGKASIADTAGATTNRNSSQEEPMCQLEAKPGELLVVRFTSEPFLRASYVALGGTHCRALDHCDLSSAEHMDILVCLSLNKTWFYYTAIIELVSGVHASLPHYQMDSFLRFWLMPKNMILESKTLKFKLSEPTSFFSEMKIFFTLTNFCF